MSSQHGRMGPKRARGHKLSKGTGAGKKARLALTSQRANLINAKRSALRQIANSATAGFLGIEKKFLDTAKAETTVASVAALTGGEYDPSVGCTGCLSCPAQGDTEQSRDGKRIVIDSLIIKGYLDNVASANVAAYDSQKVFVAIILDTQSNGVQFSSEDVFKNLLNIADSAVSPTKNLLFGSRFRILKSQLYDVTPIGITAAGAIAHTGTRRDFDWYIPFKGGLPVNMNAGTTADVANVIDNSVHVCAFASNPNNVVKIAYNARIRFQG